MEGGSMINKIKIEGCKNTSLTYSETLYTIIETPTFAADAKEIWSEDERGAFCAWLVANPDVGDVIPGSGGCRKIRWTIKGTGKRGGARVIYFLRTKQEEIWLLVIYSKSIQGNIPGHLLKSIREAIEYE
jgi:hypothetical protein